MTLRCYDTWLFFAVFLLVLTGVLMVGSSTSYLALEDWKNPSRLYLRQALHALAGLVAFVLAAKFPYPKLGDKRLLFCMFSACVVFLIVVFFMPALGGSHRWIILGPIRFQPSEVAKLFVVLYVSSNLARRQSEIADARRVLIPCLVVVGTLALLIVFEPDLGSALVLAMVAGAMLFVAGLPVRQLASLTALGGLGFASCVVLFPFRIRRILEWWSYVLGRSEPSYQLQQSLIAIGSGGAKGVGFGESSQKAFFLPASHTDFIYSIVGEEFGLVGTVPLLLAFLLIFWRGIRTTRRLRDPFGSHLAFGLTCLIVGQGLMHMGVCLGLLPTTGLTLPLISYGGSSLVASMAAMGLLINLSQECDPKP